MSQKNLSFVLKEIKQFEFTSRNIPEIENKHDVLLKINNVGICGSDVHYWQLGKINKFVVNAPIVLGHETSATVVECGSKVTTLKIGDRVALEPGLPCRRCIHCSTGRYNLCPGVVFHSTPPYDGTLCNFITYPEDFCFKLPDHVSSEEGAMLEPLAVAVHACRRATVTVGSKVLITGAGPIGLMNLLVTQAMGAENVVIVDISESRLKMAKSLGANNTILSSKEKSTVTLVTEVLEKLGGSPNVSIECSGAPGAVELGIDATEPGGTLLIIGCGPEIINVPLAHAIFKEVDIRGVFRYTNCYPAALSLVSTGKIDLKPLISHRYKFADSEKAFDKVLSGEGIKVMIKVDE